MKFRIVNEKNNDQKSSKQDLKDPETRQNSGNKYNKPSSFLQMVKNSYDYYQTFGKELLKQQQKRIALQKEERFKKIRKRETIAEKRQQIKQKKEIKSESTNSLHISQARSKKNKQKQHIEPSRRSQRSHKLISYQERLIGDQQIFDVLDIDQQSSRQKSSPYEDSLQLLQQTKINERKQSIIEKIERIKEELIFEDEGTYEIGIAHESLLRAQKFIDLHINFKHQIRQAKYIQLSGLIKYIKSHGFVTFDQNKFRLLTKINPYLYSFSESDEKFLMTFKLNGLQIEKRLQSTRRRMTQVSIPELFT